MSRTVCKISRSIDQIIAFDMRCLCLTNSFSVTSVNIAISDISLKLDFSDYIFVADIVGLSSTTLT